ncbi:MAG: glycosyltransferase family 87 protein [Flavobacteriales bacterium]|tara:strand:+ start:801 stop:1991 length:1191 start_codon:yes stop_codon:yes gene_type:complete
MLAFLLKHRSAIIFSTLTVVLFLIMMLVEQANGRFWLNDFRVFYEAAQALVSNEQVYGVTFGLDTGYYKYSPFTLLFFTPFTLLPFSLASIVQFWIIVALTIYLILTLNKLVNKYVFNLKSNNVFLFLIVLIIILNHLIRELHLGNTNIILMFLLTLALQFSLKNKILLASTLLAIVILTKPYFLVLVLPFILYQKWKLINSTGLLIVAFVGASILILGWENGTGLYQDWFVSMSQHSGYLTSSHTISSLLRNYFSIDLQGYFDFLFFALNAGLLFSFFWVLKQKTQITNSDKNQGQLLFYFLLIASVPNFLITDTEHFLFSIPLLLLITSYLIKARNIPLSLLFIILAFFYGGNSSDMLGNEGSDNFDKLGFLGLSNLVFIGFILFSSSKKKFTN